jgi:hypothetical protein
MPTMHRSTAVLATLALVLAPTLAAQDHQHVPGMSHPGSAAMSGGPTAPGQAAYGAIAEIVARLDADSATDWTRVNVEALRQHLLDMDRFTMGSRISSREARGGFEADVIGDGDVTGAIRRMTRAHFATLGESQGFRATVVEIPGGVHLVVTASDPDDVRAVARLRGLGVIGLMTLGNHHAPHHEAMARGTPMH